MSYPRVRFVTAPDPTATPLLDLHTDVGTVRMWPRSEGWDLGAPTLEGASDGVAVSYGDRTLSFTQVIAGPKAAALKRQSDLARLLLRPEGWLEFTLAARTKPVWFRLRYAEPQALSFDQVYNEDTGVRIPDRWAIGMRLPAAPFALGERINLSPVTIANDPATGGCRTVLPEIVGDAPAPLRINVNPSTDVRTMGYRWMLSLAAMRETSWTPIVWQVGTGDGWDTGGNTLGADTGAAVSSAAYSGGSYRPVTFATQTGLVDRIRGVAPTAVRPGAYKVLVRVARSDTASTFSLRLGQGLGLGYRYGDTAVMDRAASDTAGHATWVDLGTYTFPIGNQAPDGQEGVAFPPNIALQIGRLTGTGQARIDCLMLDPVDTVRTVESHTLFAGFPDFGLGDGPGYGVFDGPTEAFWGYNSFGIIEALVPELVGQFPRAVPGALNVLTVLQQVNGRRTFWAADGSDDITASAELTMSYQPEFLWIGDGS